MTEIAEIAAPQWVPDGKGVLEGGDMVGGDRQVTKAWDVRYWLTGIPGRTLHSCVTVSYYGTQPEDGDVITVSVTYEFLVCTNPADPGGSEEWSDSSYVDNVAGPYDTYAEAEDMALQLAGGHLAHEVDWDGMAPWETS